MVDKKVEQELRELGKRYNEIAMSDANNRNREKQCGVNDLKNKKPVVLIDEIPWNEVAHNGELSNVSEDPDIQVIETMLRRKLFQHEHFGGDMVLRPYIPVNKVIRSSGIGVKIEEETLATDNDNNIVSHEYMDNFKHEEDLSKLVIPKIWYDKEETHRKVALLDDIFGNIIETRAIGVNAFHNSVWDDISYFRGVTPLLMDLIDRHEFTHRLVRKLTDIKLHLLNEYERLDLLDANSDYLHCTAPYTNDMPKVGADGKVLRKNIWGRGAAQILASVSKGMREEFDIPYMEETVGQCGLVYYGCCEPLDKMIDVVEKISNLRKISVTPWADVDIATEAIGKKYVVALKPNPASVASPTLDEKGLRAELGKSLDAIYRNGCSADIVLKDISTIGYNTNNLVRWNQIAMEMVESYYG